MAFKDYIIPGITVAGSIAKRIKDNRDGEATPSSYKRGGKVKKTGRAKVHKGEVVLTAKQARKVKRIKRGASKR